MINIIILTNNEQNIIINFNMFSFARISDFANNFFPLNVIYL